MSCPSCHSPTAADDVFCARCSLPLGAGRAAPARDPLRAALERAVGGRYDIQRLLGRGAMGAVYLAREKSLDRLVALKVIPPELTLATRTERFRREARIAARLAHPNIVPLHALGEFEDLVCLVMGYVAGESLGDRMRRSGRLPSEDVRGILAQLADALDYAHRQGVVHRDIKPDNILLDDDSGRPMLTDFGIARFRAAGDTVTEPGVAIGTPHYIAPEQAGGRSPVDGRADLYSLGVVGYAMLSGRLPFEGETHQELLLQHMTQPAPSLARVAPDAPAELTAAIERCLEKVPQDRWPDGRALRDALTQAESDEEVYADDVEPLRGIGLLIMVLTVVFWLGAWTVHLYGSGARWTVLQGVLLGSGIVLQGGLLIQLRRLARRGISGIRLLFFAPDFLTFLWIPQALRRPGDVWDRLPRVVRVARRWSSVWTVIGPFAMVTILLYVGSPSALALAGSAFLEAARVGLTALVAGFLASWLVPFSIAWRWCRRRGLSSFETQGMLGRRTRGSAFWKRPAVAALLRPLTGGRGRPRAREPGTPPEYFAAIGEAAGELTGPLREVGSRVLAGARQVLAVIQQLDRDIDLLARDADQGEIERLTLRIDALGPEDRAEPDTRREMRRLLRGQLDLVRSLVSRLDAAAGRRAEIVGLLRTLWLELANLRAQSAADRLDTHDVTGPIRALCQDIERHSAAAEEIGRLLGPAGSTSILEGPPRHGARPGSG